MDFDPDNEKWQCCCCRIPTGLKIMGFVEAICAGGVLAVTLNLLQQQAQIDTSSSFFAFYLCMAISAFLIAFTSLLMVLGVRKRREKWLFPSVIARVLLVVFVTVFGVSIGVVQHGTGADSDDTLTPPTKKPPLKRGRVKIAGGKKFVNQEEPSTALRLVFFIFLMVVVSVGVFYTIFLVVRGINYIKSYNRLKRRRSSFMAVAQLDPNLMVPKRLSQCSYMQPQLPLSPQFEEE